MFRTLIRASGRLRALSTELWNDGDGWILLVVAIGWALALGSRLVFPALLPQLKLEFSLDNAAAGSVIAALWVAYAVAQVPGGVLADRFGERAVLVASLLLATVGLFVIVASGSRRAFVPGILVLGFGTGLFGTTRITVLADVYPERSGTAIGFSSATGNVGTAALPVVAGILAVSYGWRAGLVLLIPAFCLLAVCVALVVPGRTSTALQGGGAASLLDLRRFREIALHRPVLVSTGGMVLMTFVYQGFTAFLPTYLVETKAIAPGVAATFLGVFFAAAIGFQAVVGGVADRYGERPTLVAVACLTSVVVLGMPFVAGRWSLGIAAGIASIQLAFWPVIYAYAVRSLPDDIQGSVFGLQRAVFLAIGAGSPVVVGALADVGMFDAGFLLLGAVAAGAAGLAAALPAHE